MAQHLKPFQERSSSVPTGLANVNPSPVIAKRDPVATDLGYVLGQQWINKVSGNIFALGAVAAGAATWTTLGSVSNTFTTLTVGTLTTSTAATSITISSGNVFTGVGTDAAVGFTFTPKGAGGLTLTTGALTLSSGNLILTSGNATLTNGNLVLTSGNATLTSGNLLLSSGTLTLTLGNATLTNGNLILGTAGKGFTLKSGVNARIGQSTLVLGTLAVANTSVTANTRVLLTRSAVNASTGIGSLLSVVNAGVGFTITALTALGATEVGDLSTIDWVMIESA